jgi:transcriptional regulator GlxA family with amidase domain
MDGLKFEYPINKIGFYLVPDFSFIAFSSAVEPLRLVNRIVNSQLYIWNCYSSDGNAVKASNGIKVEVDGTYSDIDYREIDTVPSIIVCGGANIHDQADPKLINKLRRLSSHGASLGAVCTGSYILAKAGLLDGYKCTIHWENRDGFVEQFPEIEVTDDLFEIDRNRFTCAGGTSALDMMLHVIAKQQGYNTASLVSDMMIHHRIRDGHENQRMALRARLRISHPKLLAIISHMEASLEEPVSCGNLAKTVNLSTRQLERLFRKYLHCAPTRYYLELRLSRARFLLLQTSMPILNVALACGFVSASHFSKCYRENYKCTPSEERWVPA